MSATVPTLRTSPQRLIVALASLGGLGALTGVLGRLPADFPVPLLVVQHGRRGPSDSLARVLARRSRLPIRSAEAGSSVLDPGVTVLPRGAVPVLREDDFVIDGKWADGMPGDAVLASAARAVGPGLIAVILTGMLRDGADGVRAVKRRGGRVLVQDPDTAQASGMPLSAIATGCIDFVLPLPHIAPALVALTMAPGGGELLAVTPPSWARL